MDHKAPLNRTKWQIKMKNHLLKVCVMFSCTDSKGNWITSNSVSLMCANDLKVATNNLEFVHQNGWLGVRIGTLSYDILFSMHFDVQNIKFN